MSHHKHRNNQTQNASHKFNSKVVLRWAAIILVILLLFWLFIAEDIGAYMGWGNP
ncbi:MAG: hypothetical protein RR202_03220 [Bacteroidales bacterium]